SIIALESTLRHIHRIDCRDQGINLLGSIASAFLFTRREVAESLNANTASQAMVDFAPCLCLPRFPGDWVFSLFSATLNALSPAAVRRWLCSRFAAGRCRTPLYHACRQASRILFAPRRGHSFAKAYLGCVLQVG